jgi:hypothetical protein
MRFISRMTVIISKSISSRLAIHARLSRMSFASTSPIIMAEVLVKDWNIAISVECMVPLCSASAQGTVPLSRITSWKEKAKQNSVGIQMIVV